MNGLSEKLEREARNNEAAVKLARRFAGRDRYRVRRDRKLTEWLGREFVWHQPGRDELGRPWGDAVIRIDGYNPANHTVTLWMVKGTPTPAHFAWDTDYFWHEARAKRLERN